MSAIGYDLGSHSSYVALVRTGGIDTVDNEFSYRATPTAVSFSDVTRFAGNAAKSRLVTDHKNSFFGFKNLIGLDFDSPHAQFEMSLSPVNFVRMPDGKIGVTANYRGKRETFHIFQLLSAILSDLRKTTLRHIPKISACVFSVPNFFTHFQRAAMSNSCLVADFPAVSLISDNDAVCLNYALFKQDLPKETEESRIVAFVDVGFGNCQICIASFAGSRIRVLANVGSNQIGGRMFDRVLFEKFASEFLSKYKLDVKANQKASVKLLNECETLKKQLNSTSTELPLKIECFMNDVDVFGKTSREEFDQLSQRLYSLFEQLLIETLEASKIDISKIHSVETIGGSSRLLGLRKIMSDVFKKEISTTLNADEAVSRGCAIKCALESPVVRIREIDIKSKLVNDFTVIYTVKNGEQKTLKVYNKGDQIPAKKELMFQPASEFSFFVNQTDISNNVTKICSASISGNQIDENTEKLTFYCNVDMSGTFRVVKAFYTLNKDEQVRDKVEGGENESETKIKSFKVNNEINFEVKYFGDCHELVSGARARELEILNDIEVEKMRAVSKNSLEEFVYSSRELVEGSHREYVDPDEFSAYINACSFEESWLYEDGEHQSTEVYQARLAELQHRFLPFKARKEAFEKGSANIDVVFKALVHYRKFVEIYEQNKAKYEHVPPQDLDQYMQRISQMDAWAFEVDNSLKNTPRFRLPPISPKDIEVKFNEFKSFCDKLIKNAENPPAKPPTSEPQAEASTEVSEETNSTAQTN